MLRNSIRVWSTLGLAIAVNSHEAMSSAHSCHQRLPSLYKPKSINPPKVKINTITIKILQGFSQYILLFDNSIIINTPSHYHRPYVAKSLFSIDGSFGYRIARCSRTSWTMFYGVSLPQATSIRHMGNKGNKGDRGTYSLSKPSWGLLLYHPTKNLFQLFQQYLTLFRNFGWVTHHLSRKEALIS